MTTCSRFTELIPLLAGDDLDPRDDKSVRSHLENCPSCAELAEKYRDDRVILSSIQTPDFSHELMAEMRREVRIRIASELQTTGFGMGWLLDWKPLLAMAAVLAVALLVAYNLREPGERAIVRSDGGGKKEVVIAGPPREQVADAPVVQRRVLSRPSRVTVMVGQGKPVQEVEQQLEVASTVSVADPAPDIEAVISERLAAIPQAEMVKIQLQTPDPNLRIILMVPRDAASTQVK